MGQSKRWAFAVATCGLLVATYPLEVRSDNIRLRPPTVPSSDTQASSYYSPPAQYEMRPVSSNVQSSASDIRRDRASGIESERVAQNSMRTNELRPGLHPVPVGQVDSGFSQTFPATNRVPSGVAHADFVDAGPARIALTNAVSELPDHGQQAASPAPAATTVPENGTVNADDVELGYRGPVAPEPVNVAALVGRLLVSTLFVLATCVVCLMLAKRWLSKTSFAGNSQGRLRALDALALNQRCSIQLIEADGRRFLVGLDAGGVKTIAPMPEAFETELASFQANTASNDAGSSPDGSLRDSKPAESFSWPMLRPTR